MDNTTGRDEWIVVTLGSIRDTTASEAVPQSESVYPVDALPDVVKAFVEVECRATGAPAEYVGLPALVVLATAIGNSRAVRVSGSWTEAPRFFAAVVGPSGTAKTPAQQAALRPLEHRQLAEYAHIRRLRERDNMTDGGKRTFPQIVVKDTTFEALAPLLERNPRGLLVVRNELGAWLRGMNQFRSGKGSDREGWMEIWDGSLLSVNRKTSDDFIIARPFVNVLGGMTPYDLDALVRRDRVEDGFAQRFLFAVPRDSTLIPDIVFDTLGTDHQEAYDRLVGSLLELEFSGDDHGMASPTIVEMSSKAARLLQAWNRDLRDEISAPDFPEQLRSVCVKLRSYALRLALVLHLCRYATGEVATEQVGTESLERALALVRYHQTQARKVFRYVHSSVEDRRVARFRHWLQRRGGRATVREVQRANVAGVRSKKEAVHLFWLAAERNLGRVVRDGSSVVFVMHD